MYRIAFVFFVLTLACLSGVGGDNNNLAQYGNMDDTNYMTTSASTTVARLHELNILELPLELVGGPVTHG
jgi:hypothetical protein